MTLAALLGVLAVGAGAAYVAVAASPPPAPTISAKPASLTNSASASFTYTDSAAITKFQCSLDTGSFADCGTKRPSSKSYGGLGSGTHTFRVRAVSGNTASSATTYQWVVDRTAPRVVSANRLDPSPTNLGTVRWSVVYSEPVTGVVKSNFTLIKLALNGAVSVTGFAGSGTTYTVTALTGTSTPLGTGLLQLAVTGGSGTKDQAGNSLAGIPFLGQTYTLDKSAPGVPKITSKPNSMSNSTSASFAFSATGSGTSGFLCSVDAAAFAACTSTKTYSSLGQGSHTFRVEATDGAGNTSAAASYTWFIDSVPPTTPTFTSDPGATVTITGTSYLAAFDWTSTDPAPASGLAGYTCTLDNGTPFACTRPGAYTVGLGSHTFSVVARDVAGNVSSPGSYSFEVQQDAGLPFTVNGDAVGAVSPGNATPLNLVFTNPNSVPIVVTDVTASVTGTTPLPTKTCPIAGNFSIGQQLLVQVTVPANAINASLSDLGVAQAKWPTLAMPNPPANQDGCKGAAVAITYTGNAHS
jgi:large repetitive protein